MRSYLPILADYFVYIAAVAAVGNAIVIAAVARLTVTAKKIDMYQLTTGLVAGAFVFMAKSAVVVVVSRGLFGVIHLMYDLLAITLPLAGLLLLLIGWRSKDVKPTRAIIVLSLMTLLAIPVGVYATFIEPFRVQLEKVDVTIADDRAGSSDVTIGVLADIQTEHITEHERDAIDRLMACKPDMILIPGDVFQGRDQRLEWEWDSLRELLSRLQAPAGVYAVAGHCESVDRLKRIMSGLPIHVLDNDVMSVRFKDRRMTIIGLDVHNSAERSALMTRMEQASTPDDIRIMFAHMPDPVLSLSRDTRVDLFVAGHTHGGQVVVPGFGPPITFSSVPRHIGAGGLHDLHGRRIYVGRGLGWEHWLAPRIRFLCPPEVTLLTLRDP